MNHHTYPLHRLSAETDEIGLLAQRRVRCTDRTGLIWRPRRTIPATIVGGQCRTKLNRFTYQDLAYLRDTTGHLIHTVLSDYLNSGVAHDHKNPSPLPASAFPCPAPLDRSSVIGSNATSPPTVRRHGGGRTRYARINVREGTQSGFAPNIGFARAEHWKEQL